MRIVATDEQARDLGLVPAMALADARARIPDLEAIPHDPQADARLLAAIADDCERYTPSVALDPPDGILLDITGCAHIWEGEDGLVGDLAARLAREGLSLMLALAETPDRARAFARHGRERVSVRRGVPPDRLNEAHSAYHSPLPVAALDPEPDQAVALRRAGLTSIEDLAARPRRLLAARFGMAFVTRLARILGEEDSRITPRRALPAISLPQRFAEPVAHRETVMRAIATLAGAACDLLRERGEGGRRFAIALFRSDGAVQRLTVDTGRPVREPGLVLRLFDERIETLSNPLDPGFGYDAIRLAVPLTEPLPAAQMTSDAQAAADEAADALFDRLSVRLGQHRVRRLAAGNSHVPELAGLTHAAATPPLPFPWADAAPGEPPLRPLLLFDPPQPVEVIAEVPDGPPRRFRWRQALHEIVTQEGPERIAPEWWKRRDGHHPGKGGRTRDYYRVEDAEGRRFWLFRHGLYESGEGAPRWYLHGRFA